MEIYANYFKLKYIKNLWLISSNFKLNISDKIAFTNFKRKENDWIHMPELAILQHKNKKILNFKTKSGEDNRSVIPL